MPTSYTASSPKWLGIFTAVASKSRIPGESGGIQINFCKNPNCANFGVAALQRTAAPRLSQAHQSDTTASPQPAPDIRCCVVSCAKNCPRSKATLQCMKNWIACCSRCRCQLSRVVPTTPVSITEFGVSTYASRYQRFGQTAGGSIRYRCKACKRLFTQVRRSTLRQRQSDPTKWCSRLLVNKSPMRRICEVAGINAETLYQRIDFFAEQCRLLQPHEKPAAADEDFASEHRGWTGKLHRQLVRPVGSPQHPTGRARVGGHESGYVFGMHLNFDPA